MNELLQTHTLLAGGLRDDPLLCLASTVVWLDPMWQEADEDWDMLQDEDDTLRFALTVTRKILPDVYIQGVEAIREGASYADLDRLICTAITKHGIPIDNLELLGFGIPMPAHGVTLDDPDFYTSHPDVIPVLECFGISPEPNPYHINIPDCVHTAGRMIAADLERQTDERYRQVAWLMQWLFSCSGNSSIDYSYEEHCEFQSLSWDKDEFAFAIEVIEEADAIMADALTGLAFLNSHSDLLKALQSNVRRIYKAIDRQKNKRNEPTVRLKWPNSGEDR